MLGYLSTLYTKGAHSEVQAPDTPLLESIGKAPPHDFVLCRDKSGTPTAVYGLPVWDFNPYRLSGRVMTKLRFDKIFDRKSEDQVGLVFEVKYILYCLIYYIGTGRVGRLAPATVRTYFYVLSELANFCYSQKDKPLVGLLSLQELLSTPVYLAAFISQMNPSSRNVKTVPSLLNNLVAVGERFLGYKCIDPASYDFGKRLREKQHPVIPIRIYLELVNTLSSQIDNIYAYKDKLGALISSFSDPLYGRGRKAQAQMPEYCGVKKRNFQEAVRDHGLEGFFVGEFYCKGRKSLASVVISIQFIVKNIIHLYTGMRDQEVARLKRDCLFREAIRSNEVDDKGVIRDFGKSIKVISTTTKYTGFRKEESWLAPQEVERAVEILQAISAALGSIHKVVSDDEVKLFQTPRVMYGSFRSAEIAYMSAAEVKCSWLRSVVIQSADLQELSASDPDRDFYAESRFNVGMPWPLTSHQFRRSLAFYASSSGFVTLPSLKSQFKHLTIAMSRYYRNGFDRIRSVFGYYDSEKEDFVLPKNHIAFEFQMAIPMSVADQLLADVFGSSGPLFGGTGSYMEKEKKKIESGQICVAELRSDTVRRVQRGELAYRPTLIGGCSKVGKCDEMLMGRFVACVSCPDSIILPEKVELAAFNIREEMSNYAPDSGEHQILKSDYDQLIGLKKTKK